jgi:hypothetical protein
MNGTVERQRRLRGLLRHLARTRQLAAQHETNRDTAIRLHGAAHPRAIDATRQLNQSAGASRRLEYLYRTAVSQDETIRMHERG